MPGTGSIERSTVKRYMDMNKDNNYLDKDSINNINNEEALQQKQQGKGLFYSGLVSGLVLSLLIVSIVFLATRIQTFVNIRTQKNSNIQSNLELNTDSLLDDSVKAKIQGIESLMKAYFYHDNIDEDAMEDGIYKGMVDSLGDPYSVYYTSEEFQEFSQATEGIYYGIGAAISMDKNTTLPKISTVFDDTPAQQAGLRENDIIYEVNGASTYGQTTTEVVAQIKGEEGTSVNLTIFREDASDYLYIDVTRGKVETPTVTFEMLDGETAYIQIGEFDSVTINQFSDALTSAKDNKMEGLIIDLRSNPGGSMDAVVEVARMLLPEGMIVYTENKYGERVEYTCEGKNEIDVPLVVLINGNSASAAEILAGAVKDYKIGTLVGTTTFGKGIVQQVVTLNDGSAIKVTVSSYFTPNGNNIHEIGVEPDVICEFDAEAYYGEENYDNQLDEARKVLAEKIIEASYYKLK